MLALISRTDGVICILDVNMIIEKLRAMLKFFETDWSLSQMQRHTKCVKIKDDTNFFLFEIFKETSIF